MNWQRAKSILIVFFICTNLFLLATILVSTGKTSIITDDIISSTVLILKNNNVSINPDIIPRKTSSVSMIEFENWVKDYSEFAKNFIGNDAISKDTGVFKGTNGQVSFSGDFFEFLPASPLPIKNPEDNEEKIALSILENYGFSDSNLTFLKTEEADFYKITVSKEKGQLSYFDCKLELFIKQDSLFKINGSWFFEKTKLKDDFLIKNVTGVLIDFLSVKNRPSTEESIVSIDLGYAESDKTNHHKTSVLTPCWKFTLSSGKEFILNAFENSIS